MSIITCQAAVAFSACTPLTLTTIQVHPPKIGEVRLKILSNALCHTDVYTLDGHDPEGLFPCILGHEACAIVESIGEGVKSVKVGDYVIPCYTPECRQYDCVFCNNKKTNLCPRIRATQGKGLMPDGTSRFVNASDGKIIYHFMGCSTFSEYSVVAEISCAKINPLSDPYNVCLLGCGISTGWGAVFNTCEVEEGKTAVVFGLGAVGLAVIQALKEAGARKIVGVDLNQEKFKAAQYLGATELIVSSPTIKEKLLSSEPWGYDYTFDCTGNVEVMRSALEVAHRGFGQSCVIGVAASGHEIKTRPFQLVTGRVWKGTAFGGWKSRSEVPQLVKKVLRGDTEIESFITHRFEGLEKVNEAIDVLHSGKCLRAVIQIGLEPELIQREKSKLTLLSKSRLYGGHQHRYKHWSNTTNCEMTFSIYIPDKRERGQHLPAIIYLSGLTCTDENASMKSNIQLYASQLGVSIVFPDTSPRGVPIQGDSDSWDFGLGAGFYVDATEEKWKQNYNMYSYVNKELISLLSNYFDIDVSRLGIMGHSMGGHGALTSYLKNPGLYRSVSALAPICNPTKTKWGQKAFEGYLGSVEKGKEYDACELVETQKSEKKSVILIDQGARDLFWKDELRGEVFVQKARENGWEVNWKVHGGFDHSYNFVASFVGDHVKHHANAFGLY